jgi:hypothetical protein
VTRKADIEPFEEKMERLVSDLHSLQARGLALDESINSNLKALGYGD